MPYVRRSEIRALPNRAQADARHTDPRAALQIREAEGDDVKLYVQRAGVIDELTVLLLYLRAKGRPSSGRGHEARAG